jgi:arylsulfatase A-like enzyme
MRAARIRRFAPNAISLLLLASTACTEPSEIPAQPDRIFLFVVDTLRQDHISAYGSSTKTPNMDALAARGQKINTALSAYHQTTMSMGALFTGRTPSLETGERETQLPWTGRAWCGLARFSSTEDKGCVPSGLTTLAERLRDSGYWTAGVTSNRLLFDPAGYSQGFDRWGEVGVFVPEISAKPLHNRAKNVHASVFEALKARPHDRFFLYVHWLDVHDYMHDYSHSVERFDAALGRLLNRLEAEGLLENSWIILTSDHGESLGEKSPLGKRRLHMGNPSFETELKVPLIFAPALIADEGATVRTQDVANLLLSALGLDTLGPGSEFSGDEHFVSEIRYQTYRRGSFKTMRPRKPGQSLLFNLAADPNERVDIAADHPAVVAEHGRRMDELAQKLKSEVKIPAALTIEDAIRLRALGYAD